MGNFRKLGKKNFLVKSGSNMGSKIDHFTKNGPESSILRIFHQGKAQNDEN
jgi:hypothetical protein